MNVHELCQKLKFLTHLSLLLLFIFVSSVRCTKLGSDPNAYQQSQSESNLPPLTIVPQNPRVIEGQKRRFNGQGGYISTVGYTYSLVGLGGQSPPGTIDPKTGIYSAPDIVNPNNSVAFVVVTDSTGTTASTTVLNTSSLQITPTSQVVTVLKKANFDVVGGGGPFTWCVVDTILGTCLANANVGDITETGLFNAHSTSGSSIVQVSDASGNIAQAVITIEPTPQLSPNGVSLPFGWIMQMITIGGAAPFTYTLDSQSLSNGGSVSSDGLFVAPSVTGTSTLSVTDYYTYTSSVSLSIINPNKIAAGSNFNCVLFPDTQGVKCWGDNTLKQTGYPSALVNDGVIGTNNYLGDETNEIGSRVGVHLLSAGLFINSLQIVTGDVHACALDAGYNVRCWGTNTDGQLGNPTVAVGNAIANASATAGGPQAVKFITTNTVLQSTLIGSGLKHVCAVDKTVLAGTDVYCWGLNTSAQLGAGNTAQVLQPNAAYRLRFPAKVLDLKGGDSHTCVLLQGTASFNNSTNQLRCWGRGDEGQLGIDPTQLASVGNLNSLLGDTAAEVTLLTSNSGIPVTFTNPGVYLPANESLMPVSFDLGSNHTCAFLNDRSLRCWGMNNHGQLGRGSSNASFSAPDTVGIDVNNQRIVKFKTGFDKTCVILLGGILKCFGGPNNTGALGISNCATTDIGKNISEMGSHLLSISVDISGYITDLAIGQQHICAVLNDNRIKCWGFGLFGQLGNNNNNTLGCNSSDMGSALPNVGFF